MSQSPAISLWQSWDSKPGLFILLPIGVFLVHCPQNWQRGRNGHFLVYCLPCAPLPLTQKPHHLDSRTASFLCPSVTSTSVASACLNSPLSCKIIQLFQTPHISRLVFPSTSRPISLSSKRKRLLLTVVIFRAQEVSSQSNLDNTQTVLSPDSSNTEGRGQRGVTLAPHPLALAKTGWRRAILEPLTHQGGGGDPCPVFVPENKVLPLSSPEAGLLL